MSEKLHQIISRVFNVDKNRISDETSSENLEEWDSFNFYVLLDELENEFNIKFDLDETLEIRKKIVEIFMSKVFGKKADTSSSDPKHSGKVGHWLEKQMGVVHNASNTPDLMGYEMKTESNPITFGSWDPNYWVFRDEKRFPNLIGGKGREKTDLRKINQNDLIEVNIPETKTYDIKPKKMKLDVVYEDKEIVVINKPSGLVVHPGAGNKDGTLVNGLLYLYKNNLSNLNGEFRPGIVHRIDKDTSGLIVIAKNNQAHSHLSEQFSNHSIKRKYLALIWGVVRPLNGKITTLISRSKKNRQLMSVSERSGKKAITNYKTLRTFSSKEIPKISLVECILETGRTHQIRVHFSYKGNSLIGDKTYGRKKLQFKKINKKFQKILADFNRQALHAKSLGFFHPTKNAFVSFDSKLPQDFKKMLDFLEKFGN